MSINNADRQLLVICEGEMADVLDICEMLEDCGVPASIQMEYGGLCALLCIYKEL